MELKLKKTIERIIKEKTDYAASMRSRYKNRVKDLNDRRNTARYTEQGFREVVTERLNEETEKYTEHKNSCKQRINAAIIDAKKVVEKELNAKVSPSTDYDVRFNTAMLTLTNMNLQNIDDDTAYMILADFVEDNTKMRICRKLIENQMDVLVNIDGSPIFEKTFGHLMFYESVMNKLELLEKESEKLFEDALFESRPDYITVGGEEQWHDGSMVGGYRFEVPSAMDIKSTIDESVIAHAKEIALIVGDVDDAKDEDDVQEGGGE